MFVTYSLESRQSVCRIWLWCLDKFKLYFTYVMNSFCLLHLIITISLFFSIKHLELLPIPDVFMGASSVCDVRVLAAWESQVFGDAEEIWPSERDTH